MVAIVTLVGSFYVSSLTSWLTAAVMTIAIAIAIDWKCRNNSKMKKKYNLPPGPKGVPILGVFPTLLKAPAHIVFEEWTKKFGSVYKFTLGTGTSVVLGSAAAVREAFLQKTPDVDSRCQWRYCFIRMFRGLSVLPYSKKWVNTRRRTISILRDFGMGKSFMEERIYKESVCLIESMLEAGESGKRNFVPKDMLRRSPMNVLCWILFGKRYDYDHPGLLYIMNTVVWLVDFLAKASIYDILPPHLRTLTGFSLRNFHKQLDDLNQFMRDKVDAHKKSYNEKSVNNFVDAWLKACKEDGSKATPSDQMSFGHLSNVLQDIVIAGAHSTSIVFHWAVLLLVLNKKEQDKAYKQIVNTIGPDGVPSLTDRSKLRYVDALIFEVMRVATVLPLVAHATWKDTTIGGYDVPANIEVIYNNWTLNHDEKVFPQPFKFNPDRWLNSEGEIRKELFHGYFPFGLGKRSCAGEALAKMNLFLTLTTMLQKIELLPPDETVSEDMKPAIIEKYGLLTDIKPFMIRARRRPSVVAA